MCFPTIDDIISIFPPGSAIFSESDESNPFRWALRYPAAIFLVDCNLEPVTPLAPNAFASFVPVTAMSAAIASSPATSDTVRGTGSRMDSTGRRITAEGTVDATASRPCDAFISVSHGMHSLPFSIASAMNASMNATSLRIGFAQFF